MNNSEITKLAEETVQSMSDNEQMYQIFNKYSLNIDRQTVIGAMIFLIRKRYEDFESMKKEFEAIKK